MEVAQIAHCVAARLNSEVPALANGNEIDYDLIEFAGLAHDLGHPPFGHNGEKMLNELMCDSGGFEGNAQTFRILTHLCKKIEAQDPANLGRKKSFGLNLTKRALASILKYDREIPFKIPKKPDGTYEVVKGYYRCDADFVEEVKRGVLEAGQSRQRPAVFTTLECCIMDLSDDIAYSTYDLEDAFKAGFLTPLDLLVTDPAVRESLSSRVNDAMVKEGFQKRNWAAIERAIFDLLAIFPLTFTSPTAKNQAALVTADNLNKAKGVAADSVTRTALTSKLIERFVSSVSFTANQKLLPLSRAYLPEQSRLEVEILKNLTFILITTSHRLRIVQERGEDIVSTIFKRIRKNPDLMPDDFRAKYRACDGKHADQRRARVVCDFVAGMTDGYAVEFYAKLTSEEHRTIFKPM